jgi:PTH1 family peptidyl-tRNA hydrolase
VADGEAYSWLIVGLGNPGREYERTPHNIGFMVVDALAAANGIRICRKEKSALVGLGSVAGQPVILAKPQTFMNLSGQAVKALADLYAIAPSRTLLIYDELDLPWTTLKIKPKGSAAGHNGVKSVIASLGTSDFPRVRIGIHPGYPVRDGAEFVLGPFQRSQQKELEETVDRARAAVESIIAEGVEKAMTIFNRRAQGSNQEEA